MSHPLYFNMMMNHDFGLFVSDTDDDLGSDEESGKDWDELEEEARRGQFEFVLIKAVFMFSETPKLQLTICEFIGIGCSNSLFFKKRK